MAVIYKLLTAFLLFNMAYATKSCGQDRRARVIRSKEEAVEAPKPQEALRITDLQPCPSFRKGKKIVIKHNYDLRGKNLVLEESCTLDFQGGAFRNGIVTGNKTQLKSKTRAIFDNIRIRGTWDVENITTDMFGDLNYEQSLLDVLALTDANVVNHVVIKDYGYVYPIRATSVDMVDAPLKLNSNTDLQLDGRIQLKPTNLFQYVILLVNGCNNIKIHGNGAIIGDRTNHDYSIDDEHKAWKTHEWGHGLKIANSSNVEICAISVNNCTGDSYNIGNVSHGILLDGVIANGSRRQGVTIAVASDVTIRNCCFKNIGSINGTNPGAAIDIEPDNTECEIKNIKIEGCEIRNCRQGIISWSKGYGNTWEEKINGKRVLRRDGRHYINVDVSKCIIVGVEYAFSLFGWEKARISKCEVSNSDYFSGYSDNTIFSDNIIDTDYFMKNGTIVKNSVIKGNTISVRKKTKIRLQNSNYGRNVLQKDSNLEVVNY